MELGLKKRQVSIIMNCHNGEPYLVEALDSVVQQTFKDYEIIFWDNRSEDNSADIAKSYGVKYFKGREFLPLGEARNQAMGKAKGKYIAFLDCDDVWLPRKLEKQVELLEANEHLGLVYSDCYVMDGNGEVRGNTYLNDRQPCRGQVFRELFFSNFIPMLTAVIRRDAIDEVGGFKPYYKIAEEYDLWLRIANRFSVDYLAEPLAKLRVHNQSESSTLGQSCDFMETLAIREEWLREKPELKSVGRLKALRLDAMILGALSLVRRKGDWQSVKLLFRLVWIALFRGSCGFMLC